MTDEYIKLIEAICACYNTRLETITFLVLVLLSNQQRYNKNGRGWTYIMIGYAVYSAYQVFKG